MGSQLRVDLLELETAANQLSALIDHLGEVFETINTTVGNLHRSWEGDSADAHSEMHRDWMARATKLRSTLGAVHVDLVFTLQSYQLARDANKQMFAGY
ncbi:WXG100 family type VII secretion target [Rhodococcus sp. G-MC3]|uniref:WXG100 family type VII secretion target n=1 Tax=Rhodococcus sp. G-MC3 TaxID=3046209 RepID=UPI003FA7643B